MKKRLLSVVVILSMMISCPAFAHGGRTDAAGGHHDYNNVSGLGSYHYHHELPAHLHPGGVCPYASKTNQTTTPKVSYTPSVSYVPSITPQVSTNTVVNNSNSISVSKNTMSIYVNGIKVNADNFLYNGTTYIPIRAVADSLGATVNFNSSAKTANIVVPKNTEIVTQTITQPVEDTRMRNYLIASSHASEMMHTIFFIMDSVSSYIYDGEGIENLYDNIDKLEAQVDFIYNNKINELYPLAIEAIGVIMNAEQCLELVEEDYYSEDFLDEYYDYSLEAISHSFICFNEIQKFNSNAMYYALTK